MKRLFQNPLTYYVLFIAAIACAERCYADVCLDLTCSTAKPLAQMQNADNAVWCEKGDVPACLGRKLLRWDNFQSYSLTLTTTGWFTKDKIPTAAAFVPIPAKCFPLPVGSGTKYTWEAMVAGDSRYSKPSMIVWGCVANNQYYMLAYTGTLANHIEDIIDGIARATMGDITKLSALSVSLVTRPLTAAEDARKVTLWNSLNLPALAPVVVPVEVWTVKPIIGATSRNAYKLVSGALGSTAGKAQVGEKCDCTLKFTNTTSTYCGVAGLPNVGTTKVLPADAVTICTK